MLAALYVDRFVLGFRVAVIRIMFPRFPLFVGCIFCGISVCVRLRVVSPSFTFVVATFLIVSWSWGCRNSVKRVPCKYYGRFPRLFVVSVPANEKFECSFGRSCMRYDFFNYVGRAVRVLLEVLNCGRVVVFRWSVLGQWSVCYSVGVDSFRGPVAIYYVSLFVVM